MSGFRLSALLRVRRLQEDVAAGEAGASRSLADAAGHAATGRRRELSLHAFEHRVDQRSFQAAVAARSARTSLVLESAALAQVAEQRAVAAREDWSAARREVLPLERLEERHHAARAVEELRVDQLLLDEHATTRTGRQSAREEGR